MAKAPVAGRAKTRLAAHIGDDVAADLAAAALLDTVAAVEATPGARGHLALAGDLADGARGADLADAVRGWTITPQRGRTASPSGSSPRTRTPATARSSRSAWTPRT